MSWKCDSTIRIDKRVLDRELWPKVVKAYIESAQRVVAGAVKNHPYHDRTGNNTRRIGWSVAAPGKSLGPLATAAGQTSTQGSEVTAKKDDVTAIVATSSGYGGWLEIGTKRMGPYPAIYPAYKRELPKLNSELKDIV